LVGIESKYSESLLKGLSKKRQQQQYDSKKLYHDKFAAKVLPFID
jgi:hypothetical protein